MLQKIILFGPNILEFIHISYLLLNQLIPLKSKFCINLRTLHKSSRIGFPNSFITLDNVRKPLKIFEEILLCFRRVFMTSFICCRRTQTSKSFILIYQSTDFWSSYHPSSWRDLRLNVWYQHRRSRLIILCLCLINSNIRNQLASLTYSKNYHLQISLPPMGDVREGKPYLGDGSVITIEHNLHDQDQYWYHAWYELFVKYDIWLVKWAYCRRHMKFLIHN